MMTGGGFYLCWQLALPAKHAAGSVTGDAFLSPRFLAAAVVLLASVYYYSEHAPPPSLSQIWRGLSLVCLGSTVNVLNTEEIGPYYS